MTIITSKVIDREITKFTTNRNALRDQAHKIAMMIFHHAAPKIVSADCVGSGDCTRALKLVKAMPKSWGDQMVAWFKEYTPIRIVPKNDKCEYAPAYKKLETAAEKAEWWKLEAANITPFYEVIEEPDAAKLLDFAALVKMVEGLSKRIEKKIENNEVKPEDVLSAQAIARAVAGLKVKPVVAKPEEKPKAAKATAANDKKAVKALSEIKELAAA